ncbi:MAG: hypothetical protein WDO73_26835 [Ignavibacteriota bacterium]
MSAFADAGCPAWTSWLAGSAAAIALWSTVSEEAARSVSQPLSSEDQ